MANKSVKFDTLSFTLNNAIRFQVNNKIKTTFNIDGRGVMNSYEDYYGFPAT